MNTDIALQRQVILRSIIDLLLGCEGSPDIREGYKPIWDDDYIKEFVKQIPFYRLWWVLPANDYIHYAVDSYSQIFSRFGSPIQSLTPAEMQFMRDDLAGRFEKRIKTFAGEKRLVLKVFDENKVGFRWKRC